MPRTGFLTLAIVSLAITFGRVSNAVGEDADTQRAALRLIEDFAGARPR
jgi:hypothetical protein